MKNYKVQVVHVKKDYGVVTIEATSKKEAIAKAQELQWDGFDAAEKVVSHEWKAQTEWSFYDMITSFFWR